MRKKTGEGVKVQCSAARDEVCIVFGLYIFFSETVNGEAGLLATAPKAVHPSSFTLILVISQIKTLARNQTVL